MDTLVCHDWDRNACIYFLKACHLLRLPVLLPIDILRIILGLCDQPLPDFELAYMECVNRMPRHCKTVPISVSIASLPMVPFQIEICETVLYDISEPYQAYLKHFMHLTACVRLCKVLDHFDAQNIDYGVRNSRELFGMLLDKEAVGDRYTPLVKSCVRQMIKVKMDSRTQVWCRLESGHVQPGHISDIKKGVEVRLIASTQGLWSVAKHFGMSLFAQKVLVVPNSACHHTW